MIDAFRNKRRGFIKRKQLNLIFTLPRVQTRFSRMGAIDHRSIFGNYIVFIQVEGDQINSIDQLQMFKI